MSCQFWQGVLPHSVGSVPASVIIPQYFVWCIKVTSDMEDILSIATGIIDSDSGFISCEPLKAKYINQKYESSSKEVYYKLFRIQGETEINYEIIGTKHKSGKSSSLTTGSFLRTTDLELSHRRYAYGITYDGSSTNLVLVGSASIVIERNYPEVFLNSEVNELYPEDMERDDTEIDCTRQDNQDTEDEPEQEVNPVDGGASE